MTKSKAAFLFSCEHLFEMKRRVYMWTFTFREVVSYEVAFASWKHLNTLVTREWKATGGAPGIRVVEVHPGGHGLHFHVLIARRLDVNRVRQLAIRAGFGRIHVQKCRRDAAKYLAKYLRKRDDGLCKGTRRWGFFGGFKGTRVKDIVVESEFADNCRTVRKLVGGWSQELFRIVWRLTMEWGHCTEWPTYPALAPVTRSVRSDNDDTLPEGCDKFGRKVRFTSISVLDRELGEYVKVLIPMPTKWQPF